MTRVGYAEKVLTMSEGNHMWISAFRCIRPSDELKLEIGTWVLKLLNDKENLLPSSSITSDNETVRELAELTQMLYISVNKS